MRKKRLGESDGMFRFLHEAFTQNKPYDRLVYELVSATGSNRPGADGFNGAVNFLTGKLPMAARRPLPRPRACFWVCRCSARSAIIIRLTTGSRANSGSSTRSFVRRLRCGDSNRAHGRCNTSNWRIRILRVKIGRVNRKMLGCTTSYETASWKRPFRCLSTARRLVTVVSCRMSIAATSWPV